MTQISDKRRKNMKKLVLLFVAVFSLFGLIACVDDTNTEKELESIVITAEPTKVEYNLGEELDLAGLAVKAVYSDETEVELAVADLTVSGFDNATASEQTITVTYEGKTVTFTVNVFDPNAERVLRSISVKSLPTTQQYAIGESFDDAGLVIEALYENGDREEVTGYTLTGFTSEAVKLDGVITVTFEEKTATFSYKVREVIVQGVTETTIKVGNTAVASGPLSFVGVPFNAGIEAYFHKINEAGGIAGRTIEFVTYDDGFDATAGLNYTKQLVEEDNIFALVGHFGTPTVGATLGYIQETGVPMVYAATGINALYFEKEDGLSNPVMAVQPIYKTDGRMMTARALNEALFGANGDAQLAADAKVGVLHTTTDDGVSIKAGIEVQAATEGREDDFIYRSFSVADTAALAAAVLDFQTEGVSAVIVASNQAPFKAAVGALNSAGLAVPVFTSYVNADATSVDPTIDYGFPMYANAWLDIVDPNGQSGFSDAYWAFATDMTAAGHADYAANAFAMAGYIAASIFVEGLNRVDDGLLTWETYIDAMESAEINVPMGGVVDFTEGKRWGIASMALLQLDNSGEAPQWAKVRNIETIQDIQAK
jgi:ABC-type branched-subunit amino acid transport system substrate-binding protein